MPQPLAVVVAIHRDHRRPVRVGRSRGAEVVSVSKFVEEGRRSLPSVGAAGGGVETSLSTVHPPHAAAVCRSSLTGASLAASPAAHLQSGRSHWVRVAYGYLEGNSYFDFPISAGRTVDSNAFDNFLEQRGGKPQTEGGGQCPDVRTRPAQPGGVSKNERGRERERARRGATHVLLRLGPSRH